MKPSKNDLNRLDQGALTLGRPDYIRSHYRGDHAGYLRDLLSIDPLPAPPHFAFVTHANAVMAYYEQLNGPEREDLEKAARQLMLEEIDESELINHGEEECLSWEKSKNPRRIKELLDIWSSIEIKKLDR